MKKLFTLATLSLLSFTVLSLASTSSVFAATRTWDGGGGDANFSTAANWVGDVAPSSGDTLVFDNDTVNFDSKTPNNDLSGATFSSITFQGTDNDSITIKGNAFSLSSGISNLSTAIVDVQTNITLTSNQSFSSNSAGNSLFFTADTISMGDTTLTTSGSGRVGILSDITGGGGITKNGTGTHQLSGDNTFSGSVQVNDGVLQVASGTALGSKTGSTTVANGASLRVNDFKGGIIAENISLSGSGHSSSLPTLLFEPTKGGETCQTISHAKMTGTITLQTSGIQIWSKGCSTFEFTGTIKGSGGFVVGKGNNGGGIVLSGSLSYLGSTTLNGLIVVKSKFSSAFIVNSGGILKGTGKVGSIIMNNGVIAPGLSPGCLESGNLEINGGVFETEIAGTTVCEEYDQTNVTGTVTINGGSIDVTFLDGFLPVKGDGFIIIKNDGSDAVAGTLDDLSEGDTLTIGDVVFTVTYKGGDGNDVALTVLSSPNTGFYRDMAPLAPFVATGLTLSLASAYLIRRKVTVS